MPASSPKHRFATTRWTIVLAAVGAPSSESREALSYLCQTYWYPLYAYLRRRGASPAEAEDLTQGFFAEVLECQSLHMADPARGRFRTFLLTALQHYVANQRDRAHAQKRGGRVTIVSLDYEGAEGRYLRESNQNLTPERIYDRRWALTLLDRVLGRLRLESAQAGKARLFDSLKVHLTREKGKPSYADTAARLGMSEGALRVAIHRLRRRFLDLLRQEIAHTVSTPAEIAEEIRYLLAVVSQPVSRGCPPRDNEMFDHG